MIMKDAVPERFESPNGVEVFVITVMTPFAPIILGYHLAWQLLFKRDEAE